MPDVSRGVRVPRERGEAARKLLIDMGLFDRSRKIFSEGGYVYLPTLPLDEASRERLAEVSDFEVIDCEFQIEAPVITPESILGYQPGYEVVGDIAILTPETADPKRVASALMQVHRSIKSVIIPVSDVEGEFRTRRFRRIAGTGSTVTTHRENGLRYRVDLEGAYFTPRLATERLRIAGLVRPSEVVFDMFAGVGPFSLLIAKGGVRVMAVDKNPVAVDYLRENARLNKIEGVQIIEGDAMEVASRYRCVADRVIMNLPHSAHLFIEAAILAAKDGGVVHYYAIAPEEELYRDEGLILAAAARLGVDLDVIHRGVVRSYAPHRYNIVIDFRVRKTCGEDMAA